MLRSGQSPALFSHVAGVSSTVAATPTSLTTLIPGLSGAYGLIRIIASPNNTNAIIYGEGSAGVTGGNGVPVFPGGERILFIDSLTAIFINGTSGEVFTVEVYN